MMHTGIVVPFVVVDDDGGDIPSPSPSVIC